MSDDIELSMSVPLDSEGFMRRQCPTCERELKWKPSDEDEEPTPPADGGYFCPYCGVQAPPDSWWTEAQINAARAQAYEEVVKPQLEGFGKSLGGSGMFEIDVSVSEPEKSPPLDEQEDMRRVDFSCHPGEPVKVLEDWARPVRCPICGDVVSADPDDRDEPGAS